MKNDGLLILCKIKQKRGEPEGDILWQCVEHLENVKKLRPQVSKILNELKNKPKG